MTEQQRETARIVHQDFFDRCSLAIESGFYLEAIFMEYAAIEGRIKVITSIIQRPCGICENKNITNRIGLFNKLFCLKEYVTLRGEIFKDSKLTKAKVNRMLEWCTSRDQRIHAYYTDTEKYETTKKHNQKLAKQGYEYASLLYEEAKRLRALKKRRPELFVCPDFQCVRANEACNSINK